MMVGLYHLELLGARVTPHFYVMLVERAQFRIEYFACESPLLNTLLRFLSTQRHLLEFTYLKITRYPSRDPDPWPSGLAHTSSTTAPLLLRPQLDSTSLRQLEYIGGGRSSREEVRAVEKIYRLGSLRFAWGAGRTETFLGMTKIFFVMNTSSIKHIYLSDISRNVSDSPQACSIFVTYKEGSILDIRAVCCDGS